MPEVIIYTSRICPYCQMAKQLLKQKGVNEITEISTEDPAIRQEMMAKTGRRTVPQIYIGNTHVGGFDDLRALEQQGKLDALLNP